MTATTVTLQDLTRTPFRANPREDGGQLPRANILRDREDQQNVERNRLRDFAIQLREPVEHSNRTPASIKEPSFKLGDTPGFVHAVERLPERPGLGHMSPSAHKEFVQHMRQASRAPDVRTREAYTDQAAQVVARDWAHNHGITNLPSENMRRGALQEMRAQIVYSARQVSQSLGLSQPLATVVSYGLERSLETQGFKVIANHAIDAAANKLTQAKNAAVHFAATPPDVYRASTASAASATGVRHGLQQTLHNSMNHLSKMGVTREAIKGFFNKHMGKFGVIAEMAQNPAIAQRTMQIIAQSPNAMSAVYSAATDRELRQAVGTLMVGVGESGLGRTVRSAGALMVATGSLMRGDSAADTGRYVFTAAMAIAGGALGAVAGSFAGPAGTVVFGVAGSELGSRIADALLGYWDKMMGRDPAAPQQSLVSQQEIKQSQDVIAQRGSDTLRGYAQSATKGLKDDLTSNTRDSGREMERTYGGGRGMSPA